MLDSIIHWLQRIFLGEGYTMFRAIEVALRTSFIFLYALINIYFFYRKSIIHYTSVEFIFLLVIGTLIGDTMLFRSLPLFSTMVIITSLIYFVKLLLRLSLHWPSLKRIIIGSSTLIIENGHIKKDVLFTQGISKKQLFELLRLKGIKHTSEVKYAFIEGVGQLSVLKAQSPNQNIGISTVLEI